MLHRRWFTSWMVFLIGLVAGCGGPPPPINQDEIGRRPGYTVGNPSFDVEAVPSIPGRTPGIDLYFSVPPTSLTFEKNGSEYRAMDEVRVGLYHPGDRTLELDRTWQDTTIVSSYSGTEQHEAFLLHHHLDVPPGKYDVEVTLENLSSRKSAMRRHNVYIPDSAETAPFMSKIVLQASTNRGVVLPVAALHVASGLDSLECVTTMCNVSSRNRSVASLSLVRFQSDTLPASPPYTITSTDFSTGSPTVSFFKPDTLLSRQESFVSGGVPGELVIQLHDLPPGNYMATFQVLTSLGDSVSGFRDTLLRADRFISLGGPTFPRPSTLQEMIESMVYIARPGEMKHLLNSSTPEIARARFDSLWLSFLHDRVAAAALLNRYYSRVEEANRRFTASKEGWKTDQGMLYIVLGPPVEITTEKDQQVWYYDLRGEDVVNQYIFQRRYVRNDQVSIQVYTLLRQAFYEDFWDRMVDKWREGEVF